MNINQLTQDCILHVLSKLSLQESIPVRHVCPYWKYLIEHYHYRPLKSLKLFGSVYDVEKYRHLMITHDFVDDSDFVLNPKNQLVLSAIRSYSISSTLLTELFPNVQCLVYFRVSTEFSNAINLNHLLEKWNTTIEKLMLHSQSSPVRPISLPNLNCLFNLDQLTENTDKFVSSVLPQLERVFLNIESVNYKSKRQWTFVKGEMLNFQLLKQLRLKVYQVEHFVDYVLNQMDQKVLPNITHFELDYDVDRRLNINDAVKTLNLIRNKFPNLVYLRTMLFGEFPIEQVIAQLVHFTNLKELLIDLERNSSQWLRPSNLNLPQLKSIHKLHINFQCPLFRLNRLAASIQHLFPNLKLLTVYCGYHCDAKRLFEQSFHGCLFKYKLVKYDKNDKS